MLYDSQSCFVGGVYFCISGVFLRIPAGGYSTRVRFDCPTFSIRTMSTDRGSSLIAAAAKLDSVAVVTPRIKRVATAIEQGTNSSPVVPGKKTKVVPSSEENKSRGLRHFSLRVCKKVEQKQRTTYNEVADELVIELMNNRESDDSDADAQSKDSARGSNAKKLNSSIDEKNIRRRVYDALNVLMAMDIISKDKKEIRWIGFPRHSNDDVEELQKERSALIKKIETKKENLYELLIQNICFRNLVMRNRAMEAAASIDSGASTKPSDDTNKIPLPFIVVQSSPKAQVHCEMNEQCTKAVFDFDMPFQIHDDNEVLKRSGL
jgi:hypothetical protein